MKTTAFALAAALVLVFSAGAYAQTATPVVPAKPAAQAQATPAKPAKPADAAKKVDCLKADNKNMAECKKEMQKK
ncbi:MAG: signal peptidase [Rhodospirillales bacterium]|nr:signal peptidase [Rhodospirillales bacterium]